MTDRRDAVKGTPSDYSQSLELNSHVVSGDTVFREAETTNPLFKLALGNGGERYPDD